MKDKEYAEILKGLIVPIHAETAMDRAIELLEQNPCDKCVYSTKDGYCQYDDIAEVIPPFESCEDTISRQAAQVKIKSICKEYMISYYAFRHAFDDLPLVIPQPKMGRWIIYDVHGHKACKCSECGMDVGYPCNDKFCRYCGAKMERNNK